MIRTQMYLDEQTHKDLQQLAKLVDKPMAEVARDILKTGVQQRKQVDTSGIKNLLAIAGMGLTNDDPYLSDNHDHYLYGAPKKRV